MRKKYSTHSGLGIQKQLLQNFLSHVKKISALSIKTYLEKMISKLVLANTYWLRPNNDLLNVPK